jgi:NSS family neurotransmitter:Na+ symporter
MKRWKATLIATLLAAVAGAFTTLSFGVLNGVRIGGKTIFDSFDFLATNLLLPLGAFFIVLFLGWFYGAKQTKEEISNAGTVRIRIFPLFWFIIKFIAPWAILLVFLKELHVF